MPNQYPFSKPEMHKISGFQTGQVHSGTQHLYQRPQVLKLQAATMNSECVPKLSACTETLQAADSTKQNILQLSPENQKQNLGLFKKSKTKNLKSCKPTYIL